MKQEHDSVSLAVFQKKSNTKHISSSDRFPLKPAGQNESLQLLGIEANEGLGLY